MRDLEGEGTHDQDDVCVARLHLRGGGRVFVAGEVLGVDDGDDRVELEVVVRLALELPDLEGERRWEGRAAVRAGRELS